MQTLYIHPDNPQDRLIKRAVEALNNDQLIAFADGTFLLATGLNSKHSLELIKRVRDLSDDYQFTLLCQDISNISFYTELNNEQFRFIKNHSNQAITFILPANKNTPKRLIHPKHKTIGVTIAQGKIAQALLSGNNEAIVISSPLLTEQIQIANNSYELEESFGTYLEYLIDANELSSTPRTVIDLTNSTPVVIRQGDAQINW